MKISKIFRSKKTPFVILMLLVIPTFYQLLKPGFFPMQDDLQAFRIHQMDKCFQDFQIPCRWVPDAGYQYGYPQFIYYPPSVYYLGEFIHLFGVQFIDSVKILFILGFIISAATMYLLLQSFLNRWSAFVGAILYTYVPYKAVDVYVRGAMSEFWALAIFPLIFWSSYQLIKTGRFKYVSLLALSITLLLITHNLMSLIFLPLAAVWTLTWLVLEKKWNAFPKLVIGGVLGIGLAAFFTIPVLLEKEYVHLETLVGGYFDWRQHFVDIYQLFISNHFGYGSSYLGPGDDLSLSTGPIHWVSGLFAIIIAAVTFQKNKKLSILVFVLVVMELGVLFIMHQKSSFIWDKLTVLTWLQFPWRFLADSVFLLSVLAAILVYLVKNKKVSYLLGTVLVILVIVVHSSNFVPREWLYINDQIKFSGKSWEKQLTISIFDYLPIYAKFPPIQKAPDKPEILSGEGEVISYKKGSNYQEGEVKIIKQARLRAPLFDFPGMIVTANGNEVGHVNNDCRGQEFCLGLITYDLPEGNYKIKTELKDTPVRMISNLVTILSFSFVLGLFMIDREYVFKKDPH